MHERFRIEHTTLQMEEEAVAGACSKSRAQPLRRLIRKPELHPGRRRAGRPG